MNGLVVGLMACFGLVVAGGAAMVLVHRRHLREWRRQQGHGRPWRRVDERGRRGWPLPLPRRWMAIRSSNTVHVRAALGVADAPVPWSSAMERAGEDRLFVSGPAMGWTLVVGGGLPDAAQDVDALYRFLTGASRELGEVQYFAMDRVLGFHAWARLRDGQVLRGYAWAGTTEWNEGRMTMDERLLELRCHGYGEERPPGYVGQAGPELDNSERVPLLARRWGIDLTEALEVLLRGDALERRGGAGE